jgi:hypothetical protein
LTDICRGQEISTGERRAAQKISTEDRRAAQERGRERAVTLLRHHRAHH